MNLFSVPPHAPFLDAIAKAWLKQAGDAPERVADGLILLPTRRAARALADAFLNASGGRALLLPRITAIGAADEAPLALAGALDLPPAIDPDRRLALLARLVLALNGAGGAPTGMDGAWTLAADLADLLDEAARAGVDLAAKLPGAASDDHAAHWQRTLTFLRIITAHWPSLLAEAGALDPAARQVALLRTQANAWSETPPAHPVWAAGVTSAMPAVAELLRVIARMPKGAVVLPNLDCSLDDDAWVALEPTHPQAGLAHLIAALGARRDDVRSWEAASPDPLRNGRVSLVSRALLPAMSLAAWQDLPPVPDDRTLTRLDAANSQEEAVSIAIVLRDAIETHGAHAALVTPDRALARRVSAELLRFGIVADDSAGEPLADTPPAVLLRLLARALDAAFAPVQLLALLKHPLVGAGLDPATCRAAARALERAVLRGPAPPPGLAALEDRLHAGRHDAPRRLLARLNDCLEPALSLHARPRAPVVDRLRGLVQAAEFLAATDAVPGPQRLWAAEEGETLATALTALIDAAEVLPDCAPDALAGLLDAMLSGRMVRTRRALRGQDDAAAEHPRIFIWGLLEARLQSADTLVLGGLVEGTWPPATDSGPWMSRPMRARVGLPSPETRIGDAAHDFASLVCAAPRVILSCPRRVGRAPAVPARWLARIDACRAGARHGGMALPSDPASLWARTIDHPVGEARPVPPPQPRPPVSRRPRALSVTEIETWLADPYAIHAKHILRLRKLDPLDADADAMLFGIIVHDGLHRFWTETRGGWPHDAAARIERALSVTLDETTVRPGIAAWWRPRLARIAGFVASTETLRRPSEPPPRVLTELSGVWELPGPAGPFTLRGRADRVDVTADGRLVIHDYKTGTVPSATKVRSGHAPQLTLEACMAAAGAFPGLVGETAELIYWRLSGTGSTGLDIRPIRDSRDGTVADAIAVARKGLVGLIEAYDNPNKAYLAQPEPNRQVRYSDYRQLARVAEWERIGGSDDAADNAEDSENDA